MANQRRVQRVAQEIKREVPDILQKTVKDPRVKEITITGVDVTGDLQDATIYYTIYSDKASDHEKVEAGLKDAKGLIRSEIGKRLQIYKTPDIRFELDTSQEYGHRIDQLIAQLHKNDDKPMSSDK